MQPRFVQTNIAIISEAPFQTYTSALAFTPKNSILKKTFLNAIPPWLSLLPKVELDWGACLKTLDGHKDPVRSAALSHDAKLVVSGSEDCTIKIWDAATGTELTTLQVGTAINNLSFHRTRPYLRTNIGLIGPLDRRRLLEQSDGTTSFSGRTVGYGVSSSRAWITWDGEDVLWLPPQYRSERSVVAAEEVASGVATGITARVVLGSLLGRVTILGFLGAPAP